MISQCLCCDNYTIPCKVEDAVAYICPVCLWQNDVYTDSPDKPSDENKQLSLNQARSNYLEFGAFHEQFIAKVRKATAEESTGIFEGKSL